MKALNGTKLSFTTADLAHLDEGQKKVFYTFAHILNRTQLFEAQIFSHWATAVDSALSQIVRDAALFGVFESILLLAGELKEGWEAVNLCYFATKVSKTLNPQLPTEIQTLLKRLPEHFTGSSITHRLRNDFSFHHSPDKLVSTFNLLDQDDSHVAYLFDNIHYFDFATKLRIAAVAESLSIPDWRKVITHLINTVVREVFRDFSIALNAILSKLMETVAHHADVIELPKVPSTEELRAHYFFYIETNKS